MTSLDLQLDTITLVHKFVLARVKIYSYVIWWKRMPADTVAPPHDLIALYDNPLN